jgi:ABC-type multidrug transport system fused ATPase/permease subunit
MTSVERVNEYISLEKEPLDSGLVRPFDNWPSNGEIEFDNVSFSYDPSLPKVLKNLTFKTNPREKIGIVGRTGAGKSTIFEALFRMAEPDGTISIDGLSIKDLCLHDLRSKIAVIPVKN